MVFLTAIDTSAGSWAVKPFSYFEDSYYMNPNSLITVNHATTYWVNVTMLSRSKALCVYSVAGALKASVISASGSIIYSGTEVQINANNSGYLSINLVSLSSSKALCVYAPGDGNIIAKALYITGQKITVGGIDNVIFTGNGLSNISLSQLTNTSVLCAFNNGTVYPSLLSTMVLTSSGDSVTVGTQHDINVGSNLFYINTSTLSSSRVICVYVSDTSQRLYATILTISGTTVTNGTLNSTNQTGKTSSFTGISTVALTPSVVVCGILRNNAIAIQLNITGDIVTEQNSVGIDNYANGTDINVSVVKLNDNLAMYSYIGSNSHPYSYLIRHLPNDTLTAEWVSNETFAVTQINSVALSSGRVIYAINAGTVNADIINADMCL
jgi:hypothetical protein